MSTNGVIWITRHGEREDVVDRRWFTKPQRSLDDPPLADKGRVQAAELGTRLAVEPIEHIYSSPFERCVETAVIVSLARATPLPVKIEPGICEVLYDFPPGHRSVAELTALYHPTIDIAYRPIEPSTPLVWEPTVDHCRRRVLEAVDDIRARHAGGSVLIVSHAAPICTILEHYVGVRPSSVGLCSLSKLEWQQDKKGETRTEYKAEILNSVEHIRDKSNLRSYL